MQLAERLRRGFHLPEALCMKPRGQMHSYLKSIIFIVAVKSPAISRAK